MSEHKLAEEAKAARQLIESLKAGDDEQLCADMVEGETGFYEAMDRVLSAMLDDEALASGIGDMIDKLAARKSAAEKRIKWRKGCIEVAMMHADIPEKAVRPLGTVSLKSTAPQLGDIDEAEIPSQFFKAQPPKLDKRGLLNALKDGADVPGASIKPAGKTLQIRK